MPFIDWDKSFELGVTQFDEHHKCLLDLLNETYDNFTGGANREALGVVLDKLVDYATYHFAAEEHWMAL
jgi:hemerythrin